MFLNVYHEARINSCWQRLLLKQTKSSFAVHVHCTTGCENKWVRHISVRLQRGAVPTRVTSSDADPDPYLIRIWVGVRHPDQGGQK
jgi:hypothetical protein